MNLQQQQSVDRTKQMSIFFGRTALKLKSDKQLTQLQFVLSFYKKTITKSRDQLNLGVVIIIVIASAQPSVATRRGVRDIRRFSFNQEVSHRKGVTAFGVTDTGQDDLDEY